MFSKYSAILLLTFVNVVGFTILIPILPEISQQYVPPAYHGIAYGALLSSYALFQFLAAPVLGSLSDKYGRKPILLISQLGTALSWVIFASAYFVPADITIGGISLPLIIIAISRITDGITGGNISVAQAWVADITPNKNKTTVFGIFGATLGVGFLFGPAIGGFSYATPLEYLGTAIMAFTLSIFTLTLIYFQLPESLPLHERDNKLDIRFWRELNIFNQITTFTTNILIINLLRLRFFFSLIFASYTTAVILLVEDTYNLSPLALGLLLTVVGMFSVFNQGFLVAKISKRIGDLNTIYISISAFIIGLISLPFIPPELIVNNVLGFESVNISLFLIMITAYLLSAGLSLGQPAFKSIFSKSVKPQQQGKIMGIDESLMALGQGVSPIIAGGFYTVIGTNLFFIYAGLMFFPTIYTYLRLKR